MSISAEALRALLDYNPSTGEFVWKIGRGRARAGDIAGCLAENSRGYAWIQIRIFGVLYSAHRLAWLHHYGTLPAEVIDHRNQDATDNRIDNLWDTTKGSNAKNQHMRSGNTSGVTGVYWEERTKKWRAGVKVNGRNNHLGRFDDIEEAARVVKAFRNSMGFNTMHGAKKRLLQGA